MLPRLAQYGKFMRLVSACFFLLSIHFAMQANIEEIPSSRLDQNKHLVHKALAGVKRPNQLPAETSIFLMDEGEAIFS